MRRPPKIKMPPQSLQRQVQQAAAPQQNVQPLEVQRGKRTVTIDPLQLTERIVVRNRPERVYFAAFNQSERANWDTGVMRSRFVRPAKKEAVPTKAAEGVNVEFVLPMRLGGVFVFRYAMVRQGQGFALEAVRGAFGVLAGMVESWAFVPFKGGTEVIVTRTLIPRFKSLRGYAERNHAKALKATLEGFRRHVESNV